MIHLFKHKDGKFDIALVVKGKFVVGSNQHYSRKQGAINAIRSVMKITFSAAILYQDDIDSVIYSIGMQGKPHKTFDKPVKPYVPNKK